MADPNSVRELQRKIQILETRKRNLQCLYPRLQWERSAQYIASIPREARDEFGSLEDQINSLKLELYWAAPDESIGDLAPEPPSTTRVNGPLNAAASKPGAGLLPRHKSEVKKAILVQLTQQPDATDKQVCRELDAGGSVELPKSWATQGNDRGFFDAYCDGTVRPKIEKMISKVRRELRASGLLSSR